MDIIEVNKNIDFCERWIRRCIKTNNSADIDNYKKELSKWQKTKDDLSGDKGGVAVKIVPPTKEIETPKPATNPLYKEIAQEPIKTPEETLYPDPDPIQKPKVAKAKKPKKKKNKK